MTFCRFGIFCFALKSMKRQAWLANYVYNEVASYAIDAL